MLAFNLIPFIFSLLGIGLLITIHELGHFLFCKLFKVSAPKFAIGIGPKIFEKKIGETDFSIGIIPVAGYVQVGDSEKDNLSILEKYKFYQGLLVLLGGIIFNLISAYIFIISIMFFEINEKNPLHSFIIQNTIINNANESKYLLNGDQILKFNDKNINCPFDFYSEINNFKNNNLNDYFNIEIIRENTPKKLKIEKDFLENKGETPSFINYLPKNSFLSKLKLGIKTTNKIIYASAKGIISVFSNFNKNKNNISGFIGILSGMTATAKKGLCDFIAILAFISINLAIMNLLPIPVLDGGQIIILTYSKLFKKPISEKLYTYIYYLSFGFIGLLMLYSTYNDILRLTKIFKIF